ncbi:unnamed protein product [Bursaphelenchus xylophilus]|uniref:(pine wood nematode) hypothetical protein n=1 Tax=Bursaphelenchus xylophilus TaxID=6326 RepID=A0A7I8XR19_BURXY|nr:unnamed protein product [Bursaphelenchus xylophilus]CAG9087672.1 unnamed protein product [Bursaphelenchus xylophilus]
MTALLEAKKLLQSVQPNDLLRIILDNPNGWYFAGGQVTGRVVIRTKEAVKSNGVHIHFKGAAKASWGTTETVGEGHRQMKRQVRRNGEIMYANEELCVWKPQSSDKHLPLNETIFPFNFVIPLNAPPTFEGTHGHIRYTLKAVIDRPWFLDCKQQIGFTVLPYIDLKLFPSSTEPVKAEAQKAFTALLGRTGHVKAIVATNKRGYVPGEKIELNVQILNVTEKKVNAIECQLIQHAHYTGTSISDYKGNPLSLSQVGGVSQVTSTETIIGNARHDFEHSMKGNFTYKHLVPIPPVVPSFNNCPIINVNYSLKVFIVIKNQDPIALQLSIIIGTIPTQPETLEASLPPPQLAYNPIPPPIPEQPSSSNEVEINPNGLYPILPTAPPPDYDAAQLCVADSSVNVKRFSTATDSSEPPPEYQPKYPFYMDFH